jgi:hypothetical protein
VARLLSLSLILTFITYAVLLSSLSGTYLGSPSVVVDMVTLALVLMSFFTAVLTVKQTWYDVATAYTPYEEAMGRLKRILSFMSLGINLVNIVLAITYVLTIVI